jgi:hypothetical protein
VVVSASADPWRRDSGAARGQEGRAVRHAWGPRGALVPARRDQPPESSWAATGNGGARAELLPGSGLGGRTAPGSARCARTVGRFRPAKSAILSSRLCIACTRYRGPYATLLAGRATEWVARAAHEWVLVRQYIILAQRRSSLCCCPRCWLISSARPRPRTNETGTCMHARAREWPHHGRATERGRGGMLPTWATRPYISHSVRYGVE